MEDFLFAKPAVGANLRLRLLTASVLLPLAVGLSLLGGWAFVALVLPLMSIGMLEFYVMEKKSPSQGSSLTGIPTGLALALGLYLQLDWLWQAALPLCALLTFALELARHPKQVKRAMAQTGTTLAGVLYIALPTAFMLRLRARPDDGLLWLFVVYAIAWGSDSFGYIFGRAFGRRQLAPRISPNKTVEGAVGGIVCGWLPAFTLLHFAGMLQPATIPLVLIGPLMAVLGDLLESWMKRFLGVKDSYVDGFNIFPGHGGVLDRIDALILVTCWVYLYLFALGTW